MHSDLAYDLVHLQMGASLADGSIDEREWQWEFNSAETGWYPKFFDDVMRGRYVGAGAFGIVFRAKKYIPELGSLLARLHAELALPNCSIERQGELMSYKRRIEIWCAL